MKKEKSFNGFIERYHFDFYKCSSKYNFAQIDTYQDAFYYGSWINPFKLKYVEFAEGDITEIEFENESEMIKYLNELNETFEGIKIDPGFNYKLKNRFIELDLSDFLY